MPPVQCPLICDSHGRACLREVYSQYREIAREAGLPVLLCAPTWQVDRSRIAEAGLDVSLDVDAVLFMSPLIYGFFARSSRYVEKIILGGKRRLRYQLYASGYFFHMP